ncbi:histidine kinase [Streptomyces sp. NPDC005907]|uniref:sensor histidine kinase n=1 Tax=Streptomyces sp. NPDC005907 TaxID=3154571 RepID=UPI0033D9A0A1
MGKLAELRDRITHSGVAHAVGLMGACAATLAVIVYGAVDGESGFGRSGLVLVLDIALLILQFCVILARDVERGGRPERWAVSALAAQFFIVLLASELLHEACCVLAGSLSGSLFLMLRARYAWPTFGLVVVLQPLVAARSSGALPHAAVMAGGILAIGLMSYTLSQTVLVIHRIRSGRDQFARAAVQSEQNRFARDLHDLLGHTFSAVAMRAELVNRTFKVSPERAAAEAEQLVRLSRQSMAEFRMAVRGYQGVSLLGEVQAVASLLQTMDIDVTLRVAALPDQDDAGTALAAVLRESVTNVLRHSRASRCAIALTARPGAVRLEVTNDGCTAARGLPRLGSGGLSNLVQRVTALGGTFHSGPGAGGTFRVVAVVPARVVALPPGPSRGWSARRVVMPVPAGSH